MKIFVQWAKATVRDYVQIDSADWDGLARKPVPKNGRAPVLDAGGRVIDFTGPKETIDDVDGWINSVRVISHGHFGDHIALEDIVVDGTPALQVTTWNDDSGDYARDEMSAQVWTYYLEIVDWSRPSGDGVLSGPGPRDDCDWYISPTRKAALEAARTLPILAGSGDHWRVLPYDDFVPPPAAKTIHGIWMLEDKYDALRAEPYPGFREWFK